jgi:hypothetical protein
MAKAELIDGGYPHRDIRYGTVRFIASTRRISLNRKSALATSLQFIPLPSDGHEHVAILRERAGEQVAKDLEDLLYDLRDTVARKLGVADRLPPFAIRVWNDRPRTVVGISSPNGGSVST